MTTRRTDQRFPISVEQELADWLRGKLHTEMYASTLVRYLLPRQDADVAHARQCIKTARDHEMNMWRLYPAGPDDDGHWGTTLRHPKAS